MRSIFCFIISVTLYLNILSCKKDSANNTSPDSIVGKWKIESYIYWKTSGGSTTKETVDLTSSDSYEDFHSDGKVYEKFLNINGTQYFYDTATYTVSGTTLTSIDISGTSKTTQIENLTAHSVTMHTILENGISSEAWYYLKK